MSAQIFALEVDGRPILAFEATDLVEAQHICGDADLRTDLMALKSNGVPVCAPDSALIPRLAAHDEIRSFQRAVGLAPPSEQPTMTFLVKVDGVVVVTVDPDQA